MGYVRVSAADQNPDRIRPSLWLVTGNSRTGPVEALRASGNSKSYWLARSRGTLEGHAHGNFT